MATNCCRHFKALSKKNAILWIRRPGCATFEIIAPILLMCLLWKIRTLVPVTSTDAEGML